MKYLFFAIGMLLVMIPSVHAQLTDEEKMSDFDKNSNELLIMPELYNAHNTIVCGAVIGKDPDKITPRPEYSSYMEGSSYSIKVEKYFKNLNPNATIDALGSEDSNGQKSMISFEIGQVGLFYIDKMDEKYYLLSPDSIKVKTCKSIHLVSPLKQFKTGIQSNKITCKEGLVLIQKIDYSPACVKSESLEKLRERGWAKLLFEIQIQPDQTNSHFNSQKIQNKFPNVAQRQVVMKIEDQKLQDGALGVTIIDKITRTEPSDDVVYIEIIKQWENFKIPESMFFNITLEGDDTQVSKPFLIQQSLMESHAGPLKDQFYFSLPINVPLLAKAKQGVILFNYTMPDVLPKDDKYHLRFASFSDVEVELPKNAIIIENNTREYSEFWSYDKDYALTHKADYLTIIYPGNSFDVNSVIIYDITFEIRK